MDSRSGGRTSDGQFAATVRGRTRIWHVVRQLESNWRCTSAGVELEMHISWSRAGDTHQLESSWRHTSAGV